MMKKSIIVSFRNSDGSNRTISEAKISIASGSALHHTFNIITIFTSIFANPAAKTIACRFRAQRSERKFRESMSAKVPRWICDPAKIKLNIINTSGALRQNVVFSAKTAC